MEGRMNGARKFIYYSTIAMIFGDNLAVPGHSAFQLMYLVMLMNSALMLVMKKIWIPKGLIVFWSFLLISGSLGIFRQTDTVTRFAKEFIGISVSSFYFCSFFRTFDFELEGAFRIYAQIAYWVSVIGLILYPIQFLITGEYRLKSISPEPSTFALTSICALYYFADQWQRKGTGGRECIVIAVALLLCQSGTGYMGILFGCCVFCMRYRRVIVLLPAVILLGALGLYAVSPGFQERVSDTYNNFTTGDVTGANLSSYVLYTNFYVMERVLRDHPIMGNGLGSHGESFARYIGDFDTANYSGTDAENWNSEDASSLGTRMLSDMGIFGALLFIWFVWRFRPLGGGELQVACNAIWIYFFMKILRGGLYFENGMYFFIMIYALNRMVRRLRNSRALHSSMSSVEHLAPYGTIDASSGAAFL